MYVENVDIGTPDEAGHKPVPSVDNGIPPGLLATWTETVAMFRLTVGLPALAVAGKEVDGATRVLAQ